MSSANILFTAHRDTSTPFWHYIKKPEKILHLPLEHVCYQPDQEIALVAKNHWEQIGFVIAGSARNTRYFLQWAQEEGIVTDARKKVTLVTDQASADLFEEAGIPAILPVPFARAIDIIEFLLRISREGEVLYPCSEQQTEEIPGLLKELELPVIEFPVCRETHPGNTVLEAIRNRARGHSIQTILFHNRSSVVRIKTAFPQLRFEMITCIAADRGVAIKMLEEGIEPDITASGSWKSLAESM